MNNTSWESSNQWYQKCVGEKGHYFHQTLIFPFLKKELNLHARAKILDLGCGQGVLARNIAKNNEYIGIDLSKSFIDFAQKHCVSKKHRFFHADMTKKLPVAENYFDFCFMILALQNIEKPEIVFKHAYKSLKEKGKLILVMNHPCFRIPQHSSWDMDRKKKIQSRKLDRYMSSLKIPILTNPSKGARSSKTYSFHHPLSMYFSWLQKAGFLIENGFELISNKKSTGKYAQMENISRKEFPLFLSLIAAK